MLSGQLSNQDEDEVEDELESLERQVQGPPVVHLPDAPVSVPHAKEDAVVHEEREEEVQQKRQATVPMTS